MRRGEKGIFIVIAVIVIPLMVYKYIQFNTSEIVEDSSRFYSTATGELAKKGGQLYKELNCRDCHSLWGVRNPMQAVPAPALDGMGSLKSEEWLYKYFSAKDPQEILPSRLKQRFRMPSYAHLSEESRRVLAKYIASMKVKDKYLEETKKAEFEKLTGKTYEASN